MKNTLSKREIALRERSLTEQLEHGVAGPDQLMGNEANRYYMANASRFVESNFSEPLTAYATGWKDPNDIEAILEFVAPVVPTSRRFEFANATNAEEFLSETDDVRGVGSSFKRVDYTAGKTDSKTLNKGLTIRVDMDNVEGMPNWREVYTGRLIRRLWRNELRRAIALLSASATNTAVTWDTTAGKNPDQDVLTRLIAAGDASGIHPNRVLYGLNAWNKRMTSYAAQTNAGGFAGLARSVEDVAGFLSVDEVRKSKERYQSAAAAKTQVVDNLVLCYLAEPGQTPEDPSNIKRFRSMTESGTPLRVYEQQINSKATDITVEHYSNIVITSTLGLQKLTVS